MASAFVIGAAGSGSGKTTLTLGLLRALRRHGEDVRPFKCGPDYIDTQFHARASGSESVNLDLFMGSQSHVKELFSRYAAPQGINIVEGVMGLFDGYCRQQGSTADVAATLSLPVVLLIDSRSTAYSVAATIYGFSRFRSDLRIAGVIFNRVGSARHLAMLRQACADAGTKCFGAIPRLSDLVTPSRHLGLTLTAAREMEAYIEKAADAVEAGVDISALLEATRCDLPHISIPGLSKRDHLPKLKVSIANDEAFNFRYRANIDALASHPRYNVEISYFSPLRDSSPGAHPDLIYLPGGYPELYADRLAANSPMRSAIKAYAEAGGRILAECGGLLYLGAEIDGAPMAGVLPTVSTMQDAKLRLGYRRITFPDGLTMRGHEFHYSKVTNPQALPSAAAQTDAAGIAVDTPLYRRGNVIAGYTHLYWGETDILRLFNL